LPDHHSDVTGTLPEALTIGLSSADRTASPPFSITIGSIHGAAPASAGDGNPATEGPLPPAVLRAAALPATESEGVRKLVERAESLLRTRDIASARLLLERAAASGDGRANYLLAQSYDPAVLAQWQVVGGVSGDEVKAKAHYAAAKASGYR
jgi:hypothetical protein